MQDSDDSYFGVDDIVLDDDALAVLDQEEQKFTLSLTQAHSFKETAGVPLATKRQRTEYGWTPGLGSRRAGSLEDMEDLPEISIQRDGTYGLRGAIHNANNAGLAGGQRGPSYGVVNAATRPQVVQSQAPSVAPKPAYRPPPQRPAGISRAPSINANNDRPISQNVPYGYQRQRSLGQVSRTGSISGPRGPSQHLSPSIHAPDTHHTDAGQAGSQAEDLRRQMEELQQENQRIQAALKEAMDVRLAKEGEVSILRKGMEKTAQDHATQVARLKAAKDDADAKQAQAQKDMKEEMERLRTQFTFKQHELETSVRKPPWSARSNRVGREPPPTPLQIPSQIRGWNAGNANAAGPSKSITESPHRPRFGSIANESPKAVRNRRDILPPDGKKLPGFYNSFAPSPSVRLSQVHQGKGKGKEKEHRETFGKSKSKGSAQELFPAAQSQVMSSGPPPISPPSSPTRPKERAGEFDVRMDNSSNYGDFEAENIDVTKGNDWMEDVNMMDQQNDSLLSEDLDEPLNWRGDLHRIILTHTLPSSLSPTLQTLMRTPLPDSLPSPAVELYGSACSQILNILAATPKYNEWEITAQAISRCLAQIAYVLHNARMTSMLTGLLNLSTLLIFTLPFFSSAFLTISPDDAGPPFHPRIIVVLCDIIRNRLAPVANKELDGDATPLEQETIGLLEALCWNVSDEVEEHLASIPRSPRVLLILLDQSQPTKLLNRSTRLLVFLASRLNLFRHLLVYPEAPEGPDGTKDYSQIPHVEQLCSYLIDTGRQGAEAESMRTSILTFFSMLSVSHPDAYSILLESHTLIPSLVLFLTHLTAPLWEDDETLMVSQTQVSLSISTLRQTLFLLHHLVFGADPVTNLRHKLHQAPYRQFNGLIHMFIVTFGRLSYADPPDWIHLEGKLELEQVAEMARDLLELVVEGPEGDSVWAAYQGDGQDSATDDEELEAQLLDANEI